MKQLTKKNVSSFTIISALTTKALSYRNAKGVEVVVPENQYIYVDTAAGVALVGRDHIDIFDDEYRAITNA